MPRPSLPKTLRQQPTPFEVRFWRIIHPSVSPAVDFAGPFIHAAVEGPLHRTALERASMKFRGCWVLVLASLACQPVLASDYFRVNVKRISRDLYQVIGQDIWIRTRFCFELAYEVEAVLKMDARLGYAVGRIKFIGGTNDECEIAELLPFLPVE